MMEDYKYWAFISYSHKDRRWGDWLHKSLETYHLPKSVLKHEGRDGSLPKKVFPVFRDREELPTASDLPSQITKALESSRYLIVICSPRSAKSRWVNEEILHFKRLGREDRILAIIVDGEPNASEQDSGDFECFPEALRLKYSISQGKLTVERTEPIAADARKTGDGRRRSLLKIVAGVVGVDFARLWDREQHRRVRWLQILASITTSILLVVVFLALLAILQLYRAIAAENEVRNTMTRSDFLVASEKYAQDDVETALSYLGRAVKTSPEVENSYQFLNSLLKNREWLVLNFVLEHQRPVQYTMFRPQSHEILTATDEAVHLWGDKGDLRRTFKSNGPVRSLSSSNDGNLVAAGTESGTVHVWNANTGVSYLALEHKSSVTDIKFSLDSQFLASVSGNTAKIWNVYSASSPAITITHKHPISSIYFSFDSKYVATGSSRYTYGDKYGMPLGYDEDKLAVERNPSPELDGAVQVCDLTSPSSEARNICLLGTISDLQFSPDGSEILILSGFPELHSCEVSIWAWNTEESTRVLDKRFALQTSSWSPDGTKIHTGSEDGIIKLLEAKRGSVIATMKQGFGLQSAEYSSDGLSILTSSHDKRARLWNTSTGKLVSQTLAHTDGIDIAKFSSDGVLVITREIQRVRLDSATQVYVWKRALPDPIRTVLGSRDGSDFMGLSSDLQLLATATTGKEDKHIVRVWDVSSGEMKGKEIMLEPKVTSAHFAPNGQHLLLNCGDHRVRVCEIASGSIVCESDNLTTDHLSPDGSLVVVTSTAGRTRIWSLMSRQSVCLTPETTAAPGIVRFSPDGKKLLTISGNKLNIWNPYGGTLEAEYSNEMDHLQIDAAWASDGKHVAISASDRIVILKVIDDGLVEHVSKDGPGISSISFAPGGQFAVALWSLLGLGDSGRKVYVWDLLATGVPEKTIEHQDSVYGIRYSRDGRFLLTLSKETIFLWDLHTGGMLTTPIRFPGVKFADMTLDNKFLLACSDTVCQVWDITTEKPVTPIVPISREPSLAMFSSDGQRVIIGHQDSFPESWFWKVSSQKSDENLMELLLLTNLISGRKFLDATQVLAEMTLREVFDIRKQLNTLSVGGVSLPITRHLLDTEIPSE